MDPEGKAHICICSSTEGGHGRFGQPGAIGTTLQMYGIANCDTVRKARAFLSERKVSCGFHDFGMSGVPSASLDRWIDALGWEALLNRKGTTWRKLGEHQRAALRDASGAKALIEQHASMIRRPVMEWADGDVTVGFDPASWAERV
jgi:arsenate reductase